MKSGVLKPSVVFGIAMLSAVLVAIFMPLDAFRVSPYFFEAKVATSSGGRTQVYYNFGSGFSESSSRWQPIAPSGELKLYRWPMPAGTYRELRFDPINGPGEITIADVRVMRRDGTTIRAFTPDDFTPQHQIDRVERSGNNQLTISTTPGADDPFLGVTLHAPLVLQLPIAAAVRQAALIFAIVFASILGVLAIGGVLFSRNNRSLARRADRAREAFRARPSRAVIAVALLAVVTSCYPVVFMGRSFVSPNFAEGTTLLYGEFPTLPGYSDTTTEQASGSDVGAMAWQDVPWSMGQHHAIFDEGEWPLWNRYNSCGTVLLGQGQTMFGDPLHFLVIAANGAAWAWDLKYLLAKWLFAAALGLIAWRATRHLPSALLTAASAPFIGFFLYRINHPAFFSMCYAPWMLYCWLRVTQAATRQQIILWAGGLVVANWMELTSGTAKEAFVLILSMNFAGAVTLVLSNLRNAEKLVRFVALGGAGVVFVLLSTPGWMTFLDALSRAYTSYNTPAAFQIHPSVLLGLFDEVFYRPLDVELRTFNPSANFLVLLGVLYAVATLRRTPLDRIKLALILSTLPPLALAFGLVPPEWIARVPLLGNIAHIDNSFSCALIVLLIPLAAFGFQAARMRLGTREGTGDLLVVGALLVALVFPWIALTQVVHRMSFGPGTVFTIQQFGHRLPVGGFVWASLAVLLTASVVLALVARRMFARGAWTLAGGIVAFTCVFAMLWRHGQQARIGYDNFVFSPATRVDFHAKSPAIEWIKHDAHEPFRAVGFGGTLFPGWSAAYDIEGICGPDALMNRHYRELIDACSVERIWDWRIYLLPQSLAASRRLFDLLGVRYYLDLPGANANTATQLEHRAPDSLDLDVATSATAWPRAFFTDRLSRYENAADFARLIREGDGRPFAAMQNNQRTTSVALSAELAGRAIAPAHDYALTANSTSFLVDSNGPGVIVLTEAWLDGDFRATLDGRPVPCVRVNHAFKGVVVDAVGEHRVTITYRPRRFTLSLLLAALGACAFIAAMGYAVRLPHRA